MPDFPDSPAAITNDGGFQFPAAAWLTRLRASGSRVVVIGAGLAGLFAAAAAAERADPVRVVERDLFPATPTPRGGVPQGSHQHVLLHRGLIAAEQLLRGLREDLVRAGAVPIDAGDLLWLGPSG